MVTNRLAVLKRKKFKYKLLTLLILVTPFYASASPVESGTRRIATQLRDLNSIHGKQMRT